MVTVKICKLIVGNLISVPSIIAIVATATHWSNKLA
jgi:hypothetical protein